MAAVDKDYSTLQDIREEAGHQHTQVQERMTGSANGSNAIFYVAKLPVVDHNYDDAVGVTDAIVYDDGVPVTISAIDADTGAITLESAPANGSVMKASYWYSTVTDTRVIGVRLEAIDWLQKRLNGVIDYTTWEPADVPPSLKTIVRLYAAALIMIRSYGSNTDNELVSKDGYKKLGAAKSLLTEYLESIADDSGTTTPVQATVKTDGNLFRRNTDLGNIDYGTNGTDEFFHKDN